MEVLSGTVLRVPSPGLATVGSHRGLTFWGCLRVSGAQGWDGAGAKHGQGTPIQGTVQPRSSPASSTVPYVPSTPPGVGCDPPPQPLVQSEGLQGGVCLHPGLAWGGGGRAHSKHLGFEILPWPQPFRGAWVGGPQSPGRSCDTSWSPL